MSNEIQIWNGILSKAVAMPGVKVSRYEFLRSNLRRFCSDNGQLDRAIDQPVMELPKRCLDQLAKSCIENHLRIVSTLSFAYGLPGGFALATTIPADIIQYYWHSLVLAQKLAYIWLSRSHGREW